MRAAVVHEHGALEKIVLEESYPEPEAAPGWVKLRVRAAAINYHDLFTRRGMPGIKVPLPIIIGSDVAGEIADLGEGVEGWEIGERVVVDPLPSLENGGKMIGEGYDGSAG